MGDHSLQMRPVTEAMYAWMDHGRFVEVFAVTTGWLVVWGDHEQMGTVRNTHGTRIYRDERSVRRRLAWAVVALTGSAQEARDALALLDARGGLPKHTPRGERRTEASA